MKEHLLFPSRSGFARLRAGPDRFISPLLRHDGSVSAATVSDRAAVSTAGRGDRRRLVGYLQQLRRMRRRWWSRQRFLDALVLLSCAAALLLWWSVQAALVALVGAVGLSSVIALATASARGRRERATGQDLTFAPGRLVDGLRTWEERRARAVDGDAMTTWLAEDLESALDELPGEGRLPSGAASSARGERARGVRLRILGVLALILLLSLWGLSLLHLTVPGFQQPTIQAPAIGQIRADGSTADGRPVPLPATVGSDEQATVAPVPQSDGSDVAAGNEPPPAADPPAPPVDQQPPAPFLDLPEDLQAIVPDFVGDGPTRRELAWRALVDPGRAPTVRSAGSADKAESAPESPEERYRRATEAALQSRHVPPQERSIVRRFFEQLQREGQ
jgi:hypothetical protein